MHNLYTVENTNIFITLGDVQFVLPRMMLDVQFEQLVHVGSTTTICTSLDEVDVQFEQLVHVETTTICTLLDEVGSTI